eukprot:9179294-Ditylum_brightwellii.AAC.1
MFFCKRARSDIGPGIVFLATRVQDPNKGEWIKLLKLLVFIKGTINNVLTLEADVIDLILKWFIDAVFVVHLDMKSHTNAMLVLRKGAVISESTKQKVNARSSTEAELIAVDNKISKVMWTKHFLEHQGLKVKVIIYQDNESSLKLEKMVRKVQESTPGTSTSNTSTSLISLKEEKLKRFTVQLTTCLEITCQNQQQDVSLLNTALGS